MNDPVSAIVVTAMPFVLLYTVFWTLFLRGRGKSYFLVSPTTILRGRSGVFRSSPKSPASLWSAFALAMVLATQLIIDIAATTDGVATTANGEPTMRAIVTILVIVGCAFALIGAAPGAIRSLPLGLIGAIAAVVILLVDPSIGTLVQAAAAWIVVGYGGMLGTTLEWLVVLVGYYVLAIDSGNEMVSLSIVMTVLLGTLAFLVMVLARAVNLAVVVAGILAIALISGLSAPVG